METVAKKAVNELNGVDLDVLMETVGAIREDRELGVARFRASNTWIGGNQNRSEVTGFYLSLIHISEPTRPAPLSRMPSSA